MSTLQINQQGSEAIGATQQGNQEKKNNLEKERLNAPPSTPTQVAPTCADNYTCTGLNK